MPHGANFHRWQTPLESWWTFCKLPQKVFLDVLIKSYRYQVFRKPLKSQAENWFSKSCFCTFIFFPLLRNMSPVPSPFGYWVPLEWHGSSWELCMGIWCMFEALLSSLLPGCFHWWCCILEAADSIADKALTWSSRISCSSAFQKWSCLGRPEYVRMLQEDGMEWGEPGLRITSGIGGRWELLLTYPWSFVDGGIAIAITFSLCNF